MQLNKTDANDAVGLAPIATLLHGSLRLWLR